MGRRLGVLIATLLIILTSCEDLALKLEEQVLKSQGLTEYTLKLVAGSGGSVSPEKIITNSIDSQIIKAIPDSGYRFINWEKIGGEGRFEIDNSTDATTSITISGGDISIRANFVLITQLANVTFSPSPGLKYSNTTVYLSCIDDYDEIRYTLDGSDPTTLSGIVYSPSGILLSESDVTTEIRAIAIKSGMIPSNIVSASYTITGTCSSPVLSPITSTPSDSFLITLSTDTTGASIRYTTDGSTPTSSHGNIYSSAFSLLYSSTLKAIAYKTNWLSSSISSSAYSIAWAKKYGDLNGIYDETTTGIVESNGYYYIPSKSTYASKPRQLMKIRVDGLRDNVNFWTRQNNQPVNEIGNSATFSVNSSGVADGGVVICGSNYYENFKQYTPVIKYNSNGTVAWSQRLTPPQPGGAQDILSYYTIISLSNGNYLLGGMFKSEMGAFEAPLMTILNNNGVGQSAYYWSSGTDIIGPGLDKIPASGTETGVVVAGSVLSSSGIYDGYIITSSLDGTVNLSLKIKGNVSEADDRIYAVKTLSDGSYIVTGTSNGSNLWNTHYNTLLMKITASGNISWQKSYGFNTNNETFYDIKETDDGGLIAVGEATNQVSATSNRDIWVVRMNSLGTILWQKAYGGTSNDSGRNIIKTTDGGYAISGITSSFGTDGQNIIILKLDSSGNPTYTNATTFLGVTTSANQGDISLLKENWTVYKGSVSSFSTDSYTNGDMVSSWKTTIIYD